LLMGTFSKSFGGFGGYVAGKRGIIDYLKSYSDSSLYGEQMAPVVTFQILECLRKIKSDNSIISKLHENTRAMRDSLRKLKFYMLGDRESPIIPILIPTPGKIGEFSRLCLERGVAVVVVGYPATPILLNRVRLCMSASLTIEDIDYIVKVVDQVGGLLGMKRF
jgi:serine palmitoyltransferase